MSTKKFLLFSGLLLVILSILGYVGVLGPTPAKSIFSSNWYFDATKNLTQIIIGVISIIVAFMFPKNWQKLYIATIGFIAVLVGLYGGLVGTSFLGAQLQHPADTVFHLAFGAVALFIAYRDDMRMAKQ